MRQQPLQWHPAFQAVMQIELAEYQDWLKYSALPKKKNVWLSRLRPGLDVEEDIAMLAQAYQRRDENPLYSAVMELIVRANRKQYEEAKHMCNALRELFAEEIEEGRQRGKAEGKIEGKIEGKEEGHCLAFIEILRRKVENGKSLEESAEALEERPEDIEKLYRLIENQGPDADAELIYQLYRADVKSSEEKEGQR